MMAHIDLQSFEVKDELNPELWEDWRLRAPIRDRLLIIADGFVEHLEVVNGYVDVQFTGSLANFNWSRHSDIDLHPLIDYSVVDEDEQLVRELLMAKKSIWNDRHRILIKGFEVECYPQSHDEPHHSTGVYSLVNDDWIVRPSRQRPKLDLGAVKDKSDDLITEIEAALASEACDPDCLERIRKKIKKMRQCGLERGGEFAVENLAFKALRRSGHIGKLIDAIHERGDEELSLESDV